MLILLFQDYKKQFKLWLHTPHQEQKKDKTLQKIFSLTFTRGRLRPKSTTVYHVWVPKLLRIITKKTQKTQIAPSSSLMCSNNYSVINIVICW